MNQSIKQSINIYLLTISIGHMVHSSPQTDIKSTLKSLANAKK